MAREILKPYLVAKNEDGAFRITVRTTRFNSQGYPLVSSETLTNSFPSAIAARTFLRAEYRAETADITSK